LPSLDATGATLLPGLIDAHTHTRSILATAPGGHGTEYRIPIPTVSGPEGAAGFVAARVKDGADYLKIRPEWRPSGRERYTNDGRPDARALVEAAHPRGLMVVAHIENVNDVRLAVTSGVDGLAHAWREGGDAPSCCWSEAIRRSTSPRPATSFMSGDQVWSSNAHRLRDKCERARMFVKVAASAGSAGDLAGRQDDFRNWFAETAAWVSQPLRFQEDARRFCETFRASYRTIA
jgi:hypothetical protein